MKKFTTADFRRWAQIAFVLCALPLLAQAPESNKQKSSSGLVVYTNANVYIKPGKIDKTFGVLNGKIIGADQLRDVMKSSGPGTVIDMGGAFVFPGFNDAHSHLASGGFAK